MVQPNLSNIMTLCVCFLRLTGLQAPLPNVCSQQQTHAVSTVQQTLLPPPPVVCPRITLRAILPLRPDSRPTSAWAHNAACALTVHA